MKFIDLFSGIGGFRMALERAGHECVGYCEIDTYAVQSYRAIYNTEGEYYAKDITRIDPDELPGFDCFTAGFPCQSFSVAGRREGFDDTRGTLFFDIARIVEARKPSILLLENVKGLLSHDGGRTFRIILRTLDDLGYDLEWQVLNSKDFGVPQNREWVFIVGHLRGRGGRPIFPLGGINKTIGGFEEAQQFSNGTGISYAIDASYHKGLGPAAVGRGRRTVIQTMKMDYDQDNSQAYRVYDDDGLSPTLGTMQGGGRHPHVIGAPQKQMTIRETVDGFHLARNDEKKSSVQGTHVTYPEGKSHCLSAAHVPMTMKNLRIRRLTPKECWRLQGFPDWAFDKAKESGVSDTQLYRQAGNSVTVNVVYEIAKRLKELSP